MKQGHRKLPGRASGLALACALTAGPGTAATAVGPSCNTAAKVTSTTYYSCSGSSHGAVDVGGVACNDPLRAPLMGNYYYRYYGGCANSCVGGSSCNGGAGNYYVVTGANGWDLRILHLNSDANSFSKTCDRCLLGKVGASGSATNPHVHIDNRQYGTRMTTWYTSAGTTCGSSGYCGNTIGYPTL